MLFSYNNNLYLWNRQEDIAVIEKFAGKGKFSIDKADWPIQLRNFVLPLTKEYQVDFADELVREIKNGEPEKKLLLQEKGDYLIFQPVFSYKGFETRAGGKGQIVVPDGDKVLIVHRNRESEEQFTRKLESLHSQFIHPEGSSSLALKGTDVLRNNWFFLFTDAMQEMKIPVYGYEALKNFRFNTAKPQTKIHINSNTDWLTPKWISSSGNRR